MAVGSAGFGVLLVTGYFACRGRVAAGIITGRDGRWRPGRKWAGRARGRDGGKDGMAGGFGDTHAAPGAGGEAVDSPEG
jgi:hypothetical protein